MPTRIDYSTATDAGLVGAASSGDREAFAEIYRRYADRIHTMCIHLTGDRDSGADVCSDVFLAAGSRIGQLRDPERLKSWLYAIARHEVFRTTKGKSRVMPVEDFDDMTGISVDDDNVLDEIQDRELTELVGQASNGLDESDRVVLEFELGGLGGDEMALALGGSVAAAHQATHRMRERLGRSVGALLVARRGRTDCGELDRLLSEWDGTFTVLWRKRVARHVDKCSICDERRRAVPAQLLDGVAGAAEIIPAPAFVFDEVFSDLGLGTSKRPWRSDGFPPPSRRRPRWIIPTLATIVAVVAMTALFPGRLAEETLVAIEDRSEEVTTTEVAPSAVVEVFDIPVIPDGDEPIEVAPEPDPTPPTEVTTTTIRDQSRPAVKLGGPSVVATAGNETFCNSPPQFFASAFDDGVVASVTLNWSTPSGGGSASMQPLGNDEWAVNLVLPLGSTGDLTIHAVAVDEAGNAGESARRRATICPSPFY
jgi:RNA polymerase sigma factor (sigma-70 family)